VKFNPALSAMDTYPFVRLEEEKARVAKRLGDLIDFGAGDPMERTPEFIRSALVEALQEKSSYPRALGLPELRMAICDWYERRYAVKLDPDLEVLPTAGSKEAIFSLAQIMIDTRSDKNAVLVTEPGYPVPRRSARLNGARVVSAPLLARNDFLIDVDDIDSDTWRRLALVWVNYPNNPTGAVAPLEFFERLTEMAAEHDFVIASDEAYSEIYFGEPPPSALQVADRSRVVAFNTLSKRSAMTAYRSGCVVASGDVIDMFKRYRPVAGTASQEFVQRAAIAAWGDEAHVEETRSVYRAKREVVLPFLERKGLQVEGSDATFYLWIRVPGDETDETFASRLLEVGVVVAPGTFFGRAGQGYVRLALVPTLERCREAVGLLDGVL
jgi:acetylornithine aminotransferase